MNLDELQSVQARERQSSDLQHLRSSFYREVGEFVQELTDERARAVDRADDPFSSPEVRQLTDDIETAEQTVEAIYERRVGKVVKKASIAAADMPVDDEGLTSEEEALFEDLVGRIEENRETVLSVLDGDAPAVSCSVEDGPADDSTPDPGGGDDSRATPSSADDDFPNTPSPSAEDDPGGVSAADLMGGPDGPSGRDEDSAPDRTDPESAERPSGGGEPQSPPAPPGEDPLAADAADDPAGPDAAPTGAAREEERDSAAGPAEEDRSATTAEERDVPGIPRTTVRITADVGEVVGADDRDYDLGLEDVVTLPEPNAEMLVEKGAAERLE